MIFDHLSIYSSFPTYVTKYCHIHNLLSKCLDKMFRLHGLKKWIYLYFKCGSYGSPRHGECYGFQLHHTIICIEKFVHRNNNQAQYKTKNRS